MLPDVYVHRHYRFRARDTGWHNGSHVATVFLKQKRCFTKFIYLFIYLGDALSTLATGRDICFSTARCVSGVYAGIAPDTALA